MPVARREAFEGRALRMRMRDSLLRNFASRSRASARRPSFIAKWLPLVVVLFAPLVVYGSQPVAANSAWSKQKSGTFAWLHSVFFVDESRGWAAGSKGALLATVDGGASWTILPAPTDDALRDIFFTNESTGWIVCERSIYQLRTEDEHRSYLLKTINGGRTWSRVEVAGGDVNARLVGITFADQFHGWVFGEMGALYATDDGGASWTRRRTPSRHLLLGAAFINEREGWIVGAGATLLHTTDGGTTWREGQVTGRPLSKSGPLAVRLNAVAFNDARRGWAVGSNGTVLATRDGGRTWEAQASGVESDLYDVRFFDGGEGWVVGGEGTVIHTSDGGATWRAAPVLTPHTLESLFFKGRARGWAVGFGGTIISFGG